MKLSVVLPVHDGGATLTNTLDGILQQTETSFELIAIDDGSTDETSGILAAYAARDARIRILTQPNEGITHALIRGCREARASLIARHDAGDVSAPDRFEKQLSAFASPEVVVASCWTRWVGPGGEPLYDVTATGDDVRRSLLRDDVTTIRGLTHHGTAMFRRDSFERAGGYREEFRYAQDIDLWIRLAPLGRFEIVPEFLYYARFTTGSISASRRKEQMAAMGLAIMLRDAPRREDELLETARRNPRSRGSSPSSGARSEARALYFIASCLRANGDVRYKKYAREALRCDPLHLRSWLLLLR